jgi:hypothetical protein
MYVETARSMCLRFCHLGIQLLDWRRSWLSSKMGRLSLKYSESMSERICHRSWPSSSWLHDETLPASSKVLTCRDRN